MLSKTAIQAKEVALIQSEGLRGFNRAMKIFSTLRHHPYCTYTVKNFDKDAVDNKHDDFYGFDELVLKTMLKSIH